ncbi:endomucin isoform X2 [Bufo gargarizans]|uniref:endomucin isoform X2 n=1 Tax=Bufo gargarizans TaxID=30331 RepID=UPI001CF1C733|nr:endomucin isoform X2 [Bufo gargarizans]
MDAVRVPLPLFGLCPRTLSNNAGGEDGNQTTTPQSTGVLNITGVPSTIPTKIVTKTETVSTPASIPAVRTTRSSDPTDNQTKNGTEATLKVSNTTDQYHPANASSTVLTKVILTTPSWTHATSNYTEIKPEDGKIEGNSTANQSNVPEIPENSSDKMPTENTGIRQNYGKDGGGEAPATPSKTKKGIIIGVGCILAAVVFVVLIFLYKMCQKKPPASENSEIKVSTQTKENVKLLSVKTATPYSDSNRISSDQMEFIEC